MALVQERAAAKEEVAQVMDDFLRLQADLANYRRQHSDSLASAQSRGKEEVLRQLVPFTAEIDAALEAPEGLGEKESKIFQSYSLLFKKVHGVWDKFGVTASEVQVGDKFNPDVHQKAEEREVEGDEAPGTIVEVLQPGWKCENKILVKPEVAIVAFPKEEEASEDAPAEAAGEDEDSAEPEAPADEDSKETEAA